MRDTYLTENPFVELQTDSTWLCSSVDRASSVQIRGLGSNPGRHTFFFTFFLLPNILKRSKGVQKPLWSKYDLLVKKNKTG